MLDTTTLKIALAGLLHDIGKFAERADYPVSQDFLNRNDQLYRPYIQSQNRFTHKHAVYTAAFLYDFEKWFPKEFSAAEWGLGDAFANLAAGHHKPETPMQWIIAKADRIASGFERKEFENYNESVDIADFKKTRLLSLFEEIQVKENLKWRYPLKPFSPESLFPVQVKEVEPLNDGTEDYEDLFKKFTLNLEKLQHRDYIHLWYEHFDSLYMTYASFIPSATVGMVKPDVSLYDHSRVTAAFAAALYQYHHQTQSLYKEMINDDKNKKFLLISGDFYGIQDFIFQEGNSTNKNAAKILRGRSFMVSLLTELAAFYLCEELGLPSTSIVLNAAGKFTILAPNLSSVEEIVKQVKERLTQWFLKYYFGESMIGISSVEASSEDFLLVDSTVENSQRNRFTELTKKMAKQLEKEKYRRFDISRLGGVVKEYLDQFRNDFADPLCPFCGRRPSQFAAAQSDLEGMDICGICYDQIQMGKNLVKPDAKGSFLAVTTLEADLYGEKLKVALFDRYQVSFDVEGKLSSLASKGELLNYWRCDIKSPEESPVLLTIKPIQGYVPLYSEKDQKDDRILEGEKSDKKKLELIDMIQSKGIKSFSHLALAAKNEETKKGIAALGALKADVDHLGSIFTSDFHGEGGSFSRFASLSRMLNGFFAIYIPYILKTEQKFNDIYTVFAGGDDLFLIGPWNRIVEFADFMHDKFNKFTGNPNITISAGIALAKPGESVRSLAEKSEEALERSKELGRNRITLFCETVEWSEFKKLSQLLGQLTEWWEQGIINNAYLFRLNSFMELAKQFKEWEKLTLKDMDVLTWRSRFYYTTVRNVGKELSEEKREQALQKVLKVEEWIKEFDSKLKIPVWQLIYNNR